MRKPTRIAHTFRLHPETLDALRDAAQADLRSMNASAELALRKWLAERGHEKGPHTTAAR